MLIFAWVEVVKADRGQLCRYPDPCSVFVYYDAGHSRNPQSRNPQHSVIVLTLLI